MSQMIPVIVGRSKEDNEANRIVVVNVERAPRKNADQFNMLSTTLKKMR